MRLGRVRHWLGKVRHWLGKDYALRLGECGVQSTGISQD